MSVAPLLRVLGALKWPLTLVGAILVFGLSTEGTLSLVAANAHKLSKPVAARPGFNAPPVVQIGEIKLTPVNHAAPSQEATAAVPSQGAASTTVALAAPFDTSIEPPVPAAIATARIGAKAVNLRAAGKKGSAKLGVLAAGTPVAVLGANGGWVHVSYEGGEGWVYSTYVDGLDPEAVPQESVQTAVASAVSIDVSELETAPRGGELVEAGSRIVVRDAPKASASRSFALERGERLRIVERDGDWSRIITASGDTGWIRAK